MEYGPLNQVHGGHFSQQFWLKPINLDPPLFEGAAVPTAYKILGQSNPAATTETVLYTAPALTSSVVSTITICNQTSSAATYRIAVRPSAAGSTLAQHWIVYGATVAASDTTALTLGLTLATGDTIRVYASTANLSFSAFGSEIS